MAAERGLVTEFNPVRVLQERPWIERALGAVAPSWELKRMQARVAKHLFAYQAAQSDRIFAPKTRGVPAESVQTARDRNTMMFEARDLVENFGPAKVILNKYAENIAPTEYTPTTGSREYDKLVSEYFHDWCKKADFEGRHSFRKLVEIAVQTRPVDGDCGWIPRRMEDGQLRVQMVAGDRIGSPTEVVTSDNYFSGITVDLFGRPTSFRVFRITRYGTYVDPEDVSAANFFHYADPFRIDQYRGVTDFHACLRTARMIKDILEAEQVGVKFASQQAALIFNSTGTAPTRNLFTPTPSQTLPNGETRKNEYTEFGVLQYLQTGDKVEVMPSRPGSAFEGFTSLLMDHFSLGVGVSCGVLFGTADYKGPSVRAEFAQADRTFSRHKANLCDKLLDPTKNAVLLNAIANGELPMPPKEAGETSVQAIKRALRGCWRFPAKLTIDVGRESEAKINENAAGLRSAQEIAAEENADAFERLEQNAQIAAEVTRLAEKYDVPETMIRLVGKSLPTTPAAAAAAGEGVAEDAAEAQAASVAKPQSGASDGSAEDTQAEDDAGEAEAGDAADGMEMGRKRTVADALETPRARRARVLESLLKRTERLMSVRQKLGQKTDDMDRIRRAMDPLGVRQFDAEKAARETREAELKALEDARLKAEQDERDAKAARMAKLDALLSKRTKGN